MEVGLQRSHVNGHKETVGNTNIHTEIRCNPAPSERSALGKRKQNTRHEATREPSNPPNKRPRQTSISSSNQLCHQCSNIRWDRIYDWTSYKQRTDWAGIPICQVKQYYRNIPSSTTCSLCRQLHAPWIEPFLKRQDPEGWKANDLGDQITVFPNLRHLPHVNDYPTSRKVLREHDAPYHIAVVPIGRKWRYALPKHLASKGMVIVLPEALQSSDLFVPQQVSRKFEPDMVLKWLKRCQRHKRCHPRAPEVKGMKVIDCSSNNLTIQDYHHGDAYVALSYVWAKSTISGTASSALALTELPRSEYAAKAKPKKTQAVGRSPLQAIQPRLDFAQRKSFQRAVPASRPMKPHCVAGALEKKPDSKLPEDIPLTIRDAIRVTRALGYRYLWVDKYCIDQNNETEKRQQCIRMKDIYAGSQLTICALGCDSNYGLPGVSSRPRLEQRLRTTIGQHEFVSTMPDPHLSIDQSRWSTRGWTYQEGLFSTRRLFFTDYQVYFECNAMNCVESFKSSLSVLHTQNGQRFRAYHRAGKFVCGNSNQYSHVEVSRSKANHRKIDTIRRCQYQIQQYSRRELTNKEDILEAFAGIASFYANTTAEILSLAGIPIPYPISKLRKNEQERLNHLSYALAWIHDIRSIAEPDPGDVSDSWPACVLSPSTGYGNTKPQRRAGFPSWSWAGWIGAIKYRKDLPYCWTSYLSSVRIDFKGGDSETYDWLGTLTNCKPYIIRKLLMANMLHFDAYILNPQKLKFWESGPDIPCGEIPSDAVQVYLSTGPCPLKRFYQKLIDREFECVVLGTYGQPDQAIFRSIQTADRKSRRARNRRIDLFERTDPDAIICLLVRTVNGISHRVGILKVKLEDSAQDFTLQDWGLHEKRSFKLL